MCKGVSIGMKYLDDMGRRPVLIYGSIGMTISMILLTVSVASDHKTATIVSMLVFVLRSVTEFCHN